MEKEPLQINLDPFSHYDNMPFEYMLTMAGLIPQWLDDPNFSELEVIQVFDICYAHGGGFRPMEGFTHDDEYTLSYTGDPDMYPLIQITRGLEQVYIYQHSWVGVVGLDGSFQVARMD